MHLARLPHQHGVRGSGSDGTADGTQQVADLVPGGSSNLSGSTRSGSLVYFTAEEALHGRELWAIPVSALGQLPPCTGDCNHDDKVAINELIVGLNIALGHQLLTNCPEFDRDTQDGVDPLADGLVATLFCEAHIVQVVSNALKGCGG